MSVSQVHPVNYEKSKARKACVFQTSKAQIQAAHDGIQGRLMMIICDELIAIGGTEIEEISYDLARGGDTQEK